MVKHYMKKGTPFRQERCALLIDAVYCVLKRRIMSCLFHHILRAACGLEECHLSDGLLVEKCIGKHFDDTELPHRRLHADIFLAFIIDAYACL